MTKGDAVISVGSNAYGKASTGLNILRETVMGRELFDFAFMDICKALGFQASYAWRSIRTNGRCKRS
jgi:hypothetical protein